VLDRGWTLGSTKQVTGKLRWPLPPLYRRPIEGLNDIVYTDYHKFGAEARMLPGFDVVPEATASPAGNGQSPRKLRPTAEL
jgi:hypothetical protein